MNKSEIKQRIEKLKSEINHHRYLYHVLDKQEISDGALDSLKNELEKLERANPEFVTPDSPTQRVAGEIAKGFKKVTHRYRMYSLFDAFSEEEMGDWQERLRRVIKLKFKSYKVTDYFCELKLDGLAMSLRYVNGVFVEGATRGDGQVGEEVTRNLKTIEAIPLSLRLPTETELKKIGLNPMQIKKILEAVENGEIIVRGEAVMTKKVLEELNKKYKKEGRPILANPRNGAAGSIRQLDPKLSAERKLDFYVYEIPSELGLEKQEQKIKLAKLIGFKTLASSRLCKDLNEVQEFYNKQQTGRAKLPFEVDGVVVKVNDLSLWDELGIVGKGPRYMMAYKFPAEQVTTIVKDVIWQVGRTGALTPLAELEPVRVGGVTVSHSTLHNMDEIKRLGLRIGDTVIVERAGDVIPKVIQVMKNLRIGKEREIKAPSRCPICESAVKQVEGEVAYKCANKNCYAVNLRKLIHWASKGAMDIDGLGKKIVEQLVKEGLVRDVSDFYKLREEDLKPLERFAEKSAKNLINSIQSRKEVDLARFIYALGIHHVGEETALTLSRKLKVKSYKVTDLIKAVKEIKLEEIDDIGPIVGSSIYDWFREEKNIRLLEKLDSAGIVFSKQKTENRKQGLAGKVFVLTGSLESLTRDEAKAKIRELGGKTSSTVSKGTDYVVAGAEPGSKYDKAKELGVKILDEGEFRKML